MREGRERERGWGEEGMNDGDEERMKITQSELNLNREKVIKLCAFFLLDRAN